MFVTKICLFRSNAPLHAAEIAGEGNRALYAGCREDPV
jgi:hypothetical protein